MRPIFHEAEYVAERHATSSLLLTTRISTSTWFTRKAKTPQPRSTTLLVCFVCLKLPTWEGLRLCTIWLGSECACGDGITDRTTDPLLLDAAALFGCSLVAVTVR